MTLFQLFSRKMSPYFVKVTYLNIVYVDEMPPDCDKVETYITRRNLRLTSCDQLCTQTV